MIILINNVKPQVVLCILIYIELINENKRSFAILKI